jgi:S-adenosylmethionine synthetase
MTRKSVQEGKPDRIADLLEEAADEIIKLKETIAEIKNEN